MGEWSFRISGCFVGEGGNGLQGQKLGDPIRSNPFMPICNIPNLNINHFLMRDLYVLGDICNFKGWRCLVFSMQEFVQGSVPSFPA